MRRKDRTTWERRIQETPDGSSTRKGGRQFKEIESASTWGETWDVARRLSRYTVGIKNNK